MQVLVLVPRVELVLRHEVMRADILQGMISYVLKRVGQVSFHQTHLNSSTLRTTRSFLRRHKKLPKAADGRDRIFFLYTACEKTLVVFEAHNNKKHHSKRKLVLVFGLERRRTEFISSKSYFPYCLF